MPEERDAHDKSAVDEAKKIAVKSDNKGHSARKYKKGTTRGPEQDHTPSGKREAKAPATSNPKSTPNARPSSLNQLGKPSSERSKFVVMGKDVLLGYWKDSSEPEVMNKHAMYGVIQAHGVCSNDGELKNLLVDKYFVNDAPPHGDIYREIRALHLEGKHKRSCFSRTQLKYRDEENFELLFRNQSLASLFDEVLPVPGLWYAFKLSRIRLLMQVEKLFPN
ncbi:hypothetical protein VE03_10515, partial [Pseudogymnoascus sp. 23342-1-I1]